MPPFPKAAHAALCVILCSTTGPAATSLETSTRPSHFIKSCCNWMSTSRRAPSTVPIGAESRIGVLKVPGAGFGLDLIEYKDINRKPAMLRNQDPGKAICFCWCAIKTQRSPD